MASVHEQNIQSALGEINSGKPLRQAAENWGVAPATLHGRTHGAVSKKEAKLTSMKLSPQEEIFLVEWCLNEEAAGRAPSKARVKRMAELILSKAGVFQLLGQRWVDRFLRRHSRVKMKGSSLLDAERKKGSTKAKYEDFYARLKHQIESKNIPPCHIAHMDEHGMQETETAAGSVIGDSLTSRALVQSGKTTTWASVLEAGTAVGIRLTPVVVLTGASLQAQWFPPFMENQEQLRDWKYDYSLTGFSNAAIALKWLKEVYIPETKPSDPNQWRLLILDEHSSHDSDDFMFTAFSNKVFLLFLPPHTSHKTQPMDRSVFSPIKTYFRELTLRLAGCLASAPANKQRFFLAYREASQRGCTDRNIRSGFKKAGIWPFNPQKVLGDPQALIGDSPPPPERPLTPEAIPTQEEGVFTTPKKSLDIVRALGEARGHVSPGHRTVRGLLTKAGKALDQSNTERAILQAKVERLEEDFRAVKPHTRKRIREDRNDKFIRIGEIVKAQEASRRPPKRRRAATPEDLQPVVDEAQEMIVCGLQRVREAEDMQ